MTSSRSSGSSWTPKQNKHFEEALAMYGKDSPDCWHNIARATGKSVEEVKRHYELLARDIMQIESDQVPLPNYRSIASNGRGYANEQRNVGYEVTVEEKVINEKGSAAMTLPITFTT